MYKLISENEFNNLLYKENRMSIFEDVGFDDVTRQAEIKEDLQSKILEVTFTKKNGEQRVMTCTLMTSAIPLEARPKPLVEGETPKPNNPDNQSVWDIKAEGWRSFIWANVISITTSEIETV